MCSAHSPIFLSLHLHHSSFSNPSTALPTSQLILNPSIVSPTSQFILQPFFRFSYVTSSSLNWAHSPTLPSLHLCNSSFYNPSVASPSSQLTPQPFCSSPTSQLTPQPFCCFTYITVHSPTLLLFHLCHSSFSNPYFASPTSQALHLVSHPCVWSPWS